MRKLAGCLAGSFLPGGSAAQRLHQVKIKVYCCSRSHVHNRAGMRTARATYPKHFNTHRIAAHHRATSSKAAQQQSSVLPTAGPCAACLAQPTLAGHAPPCVGANETQQPRRELQCAASACRRAAAVALCTGRHIPGTEAAHSADCRNLQEN